MRVCGLGFRHGLWSMVNGSGCVAMDHHPPRDLSPKLSCMPHHGTVQNVLENSSRWLGLGFSTLTRFPTCSSGGVALSRFLGPVVPSFRALSGRLKFTVRRHAFNKASLPILTDFPLPYPSELPYVPTVLPTGVPRS